MNNEMRATAVKRRLPLEAPEQGHVAKRLRGSTVTGDGGLLGTTSGNEPNDSESDGVEDISGGAGDESGRDVEEDSETSSSGSEPNHASDETSGGGGGDDDDNEVSSTPSVTTSSTDGGEYTEQIEHIQNLPQPLKPSISTSSQPSGLHAKLSTFLPKLQAANAALQNPAAALTRRLDQVDDDEEHYIEMNLGLGVLKERSGRLGADGVRLTGDCDTSSTNSDEASSSGSAETAHEAREPEVETTRLLHLKGDKQATRKRPSIQEIPGS